MEKERSILSDFRTADFIEKLCSSIYIILIYNLLDGFVRVLFFMVNHGV